MATAMTRFEIQLPQVSGRDDPIYTATSNFLNSLSSLCPYISNQEAVHATGDIGQYSAVVQLIYGVFPVAQNATALGYLNTLNTALQAAGASPVLCIAWQVTSEP